MGGRGSSKMGNYSDTPVEVDAPKRDNSFLNPSLTRQARNNSYLYNQKKMEEESLISKSLLLQNTTKNSSQQSNPLITAQSNSSKSMQEIPYKQQSIISATNLPNTIEQNFVIEKTNRPIVQENISANVNSQQVMPFQQATKTELSQNINPNMTQTLKNNINMPKEKSSINSVNFDQFPLRHYENHREGDATFADDILEGMARLDWTKPQLSKEEEKNIVDVSKPLDSNYIDPLWDTITQEHQKNEPFYYLVSTPLAIGKGLVFGKLYSGSNKSSIPDIEHQFLMSTNGKNYGRDTRGIVTDVSHNRRLRVENKAKRYKAKFIDRAIRVMEIEEQVRMQSPNYKAYDFINNNCQHYVQSIINLAERYAREAGESLTY